CWFHGFRFGLVDLLDAHRDALLSKESNISTFSPVRASRTTLYGWNQQQSSGDRLENASGPGLGRRDVQQRGGLGQRRVSGAQGVEYGGMFGDRPRRCPGFDHATPGTSARSAAGNPLQHRGEGFVAGG